MGVVRPRGEDQVGVPGAVGHRRGQLRLHPGEAGVGQPQADGLGGVDAERGQRRTRSPRRGRRPAAPASRRSTRDGWPPRRWRRAGAAGRPSAARAPISPPTPRTSSSGWAAQTSTVRQAGSSTRSGQCCPDSQRRHSASGVPGTVDGPPGAGWGRLTIRRPSTAARRGPRDRARRGAAARRRTGRRPAGRARASCASGPAPSARPTVARTSSTDRATTARTRRARSRAAGRSAGSRVDLPGRVAQGGVGGVQRDVDRADGGRQQRVRGTGRSDGRAARAATARAPPAQTAATPMPAVPEAGPVDVGPRFADRRRPGRRRSARRAVSLATMPGPAQTVGSAPDAAPRSGRRGTAAGRRRRAP